MRIEVQVGGEEPVTYPVNKSRFFIGSSSASDIPIEHKAGVSRKHLQLDVEGDKVFVTDMGSTNGTFLNDERLTPGKRVEFTTFFPLRLGASVILSLHSEDNSSVSLKRPGREDSTLPGGTSATSIAPRARPAGKIVKKPAKQVHKKKPKNSGGLGSFLPVLLIVGGAAAYHFNSQNEEVPVQEVATPPPVVKKVETQEAPKAPVLIPDSELPTTEELQATFGELKCATTTEKRLCELIPETTISYGGVVESIDRITVLLPEKKWYKEAIERFHDPGGDKTKHTQLIYLVFQIGLKSFPWTEIEKNLFFVFYRIEDSRPTVSSVIAIRPKEIPSLLSTLPSDPFIRMVKKLPEYGAFFKVVKTTPGPEPEPEVKAESGQIQASSPQGSGSKTLNDPQTQATVEQTPQNIPPPPPPPPAPEEKSIPIATQRPEPERPELQRTREVREDSRREDSREGQRGSKFGLSL